MRQSAETGTVIKVVGIIYYVLEFYLIAILVQQKKFTTG